MDKSHTVETWLFYGICDLYFSFQTEDWEFDYQSAFSGIMGLEKHLKAALIFSKWNEIEGLNDTDAKLKIQKIAQKYGHNFETMFSDLNEFFKEDKFNKIINQSYDSYEGKKLILSLKDSYMETRYPVIKSVSMGFPIDELEGIYHNPLASSGFHNFIKATCEYIVSNLISEINESRLFSNVEKAYEHLEPFNRFKNLYFKSHWAKAL